MLKALFNTVVIIVGILALLALTLFFIYSLGSYWIDVSHYHTLFPFKEMAQRERDHSFPSFLGCYMCYMACGGFIAYCSGKVWFAIWDGWRDYRGH